MTRDEIVERMGWEPHAEVDAVTVGTNSLLDRIERIVGVAVAAERERCAKVCEDIERKKWEVVRNGGHLAGVSAADCSLAIRAGVWEANGKDDLTRRSGTSASA